MILIFWQIGDSASTKLQNLASIEAPKANCSDQDGKIYSLPTLLSKDETSKSTKDIMGQKLEPNIATTVVKSSTLKKSSDYTLIESRQTNKGLLNF